MASKLVHIQPLVAASSDPTKPVPADYWAVVTTVDDRPERPVDPGYGHPDWAPGHPAHPLPPSPGHPWLPGMVGGGHPSHPIYHPDKPVPPGETVPPEPPPTIWPPLDPKPPEGPGKPPVEGTPPGYILVWIPGYGHRWVRIGGEKPPATAEPKPA